MTVSGGTSNDEDGQDNHQQIKYQQRMQNFHVLKTVANSINSLSLTNCFKRCWCLHNPILCRILILITSITFKLNSMFSLSPRSTLKYMFSLQNLVDLYYFQMQFSTADLIHFQRQSFLVQSLRHSRAVRLFQTGIMRIVKDLATSLFAWNSLAFFASTFARLLEMRESLNAYQVLVWSLREQCRQARERFLFSTKAQKYFLQMISSLLRLQYPLTASSFCRLVVLLQNSLIILFNQVNLRLNSPKYLTFFTVSSDINSSSSLSLRTKLFHATNAL